MLFVSNDHMCMLQYVHREKRDAKDGLSIRGEREGCVLDE